MAGIPFDDVIMMNQCNKALHIHSMHVKNLKEYKYTYQLTRETVRTLPRYAFYDLKTGQYVRMYIMNVNENTVLHGMFIALM